MNRSNSLPFRDRKLDPPICRVTDAILYDAVVDLGREITRQTVIAEHEGDYKTVDLLLHEKDRVHLLRRKLSHVAH